MFERRLKILLVLLFVMVGGLALRSFQVQVVQHKEWDQAARASLKKAQLVDTVRGSILDVRGRVIATDQACIDACVDYRAIQDPPDESWVRARARERRSKASQRGDPVRPLAEEIAFVKADIADMWTMFAKLPGSSEETITQTRRSIIQSVEKRRRIVWYAGYQRAMDKHEATTKPAWYKRWVAGSDRDAPKLEDYEIEVGEQISTHPILRNISAEVNNFLDKNRDRFPGLDLKSGITRTYPYGEASAHLLGHLSRVSADDLDADADESELRQYLPSDLIGRSGLEALFEPELRGARGKIVRQALAEPVTDEVTAVPGQDVRTTIDIALQARIQELFAKARFQHHDNSFETSPMHGAAVVLDIATNEVRAMASYPAFDPNLLAQNMQRLLEDEINIPLMNRATMSMLEPGSTVKPLVGLGAITDGLISVDNTISCNGFLVIGGNQQKVGRCWTQTQFKTDHEHVPYADPHPTGNLTYTDAIQRSCNVYFETLGNRLGIERLSYWMGQFGLGRPTEIGVTEVAGRIPNQVKVPKFLERSVSWFGAIGQGKVAATPIQMANVAATIARDGVWMKPHLYLVAGGPPKRMAASTTPDRIDLNLNRAAVRAAKLGMVKVVNTKAGSATAIKRDDILLAGKTGTAQASPFTYRKRDENGQLVRDAAGNVVREELRLSTQANPNRQAPWYRGTGSSGVDRAHAWFIGFAPADNPTIAYCVLVEYGGGGGRSAAPIAKDIIQACVDNGYLSGNSLLDGVGIEGTVAPAVETALGDRETTVDR